MKNFTLFLFCILFLYVLTGCNPKIGRNITKIYPPLENNVEVKVYHNQSEVPANIETLGVIKSSDSGFSTNCSLPVVMQYLKAEARKIGGNALLIAEHKAPDLWSSCHRINAIVFRIDKNSVIEEPVIEKETGTEIEEKFVKERKQDTETTSDIINSHKNDSIMIWKRIRKLPVFKLAANYGYGWRTAKLSSGLDPVFHELFDEMQSGPVWDASLQYYFNDTFGLGLTYGNFSSKHGLDVTADGYRGHMVGKTRINYFGPSFLMRYSSNPLWMFNFNVGIGYIDLNQRFTISGKEYLKFSGSTLGALLEGSVEYRIYKNLGIGVNASLFGGALDEIDVRENGRKGTIKLDDELEGLGTFRLSFGLRYYFD